MGCPTDRVICQTAVRALLGDGMILLTGGVILLADGVILLAEEEALQIEEEALQNEEEALQTGETEKSLLKDGECHQTENEALADESLPRRDQCYHLVGELQTVEDVLKIVEDLQLSVC